MISDRRLFLTADKRSIVEEGDTRAAFLFCLKGDYYDEVEAAKFGWPPPPVQVVPEAKAVLEPPSNKAVEWPPEVKRNEKRPRLIRRGARRG
jgi:hypothetical protein